MISSVIHATCTLLRADESLHLEGNEAHIAAQWRHGASGLLIGGTMGLMQLLKRQAFTNLVRHSVQVSRGQGEILIGVGDTGFERTLERIREAEIPGVDGLVVVTPYFFKFSQTELVDYYRELAAEASRPVFVYYLPALTGVTLSLDTATQIAHLPNIAGIKSSADFAWTSSLMERVPSEFRVIAAAPNIFSKLLRAGVPEQLDGIFSVVPAHTEKLVQAARANDWQRADQLQGQLNTLLAVMAGRYGIFPASTALLNVQGIPGNCAIRPMRELTPERTEALLEEPIVQQCLGVPAAAARSVPLNVPVSSNGSH
jgi:4-hydroxy-tetrahydrodipicolinate synthase